MLQLTDQQRQQVLDITLSVLHEPFALFVYGSRAKEQARPYSDLDLLIKADHKLPVEQRYQLKDAFEFSDLPFRVDIQDWYALSDDFKQNIENQLIKLN